MWDAAQYLKYAQERSRPFFDLLARVQLDAPRVIADLGCGPGNLTRLLGERWPTAHVTGIDSSEEMLEQARRHAMPGRLDFVQADMTRWRPDREVDLIISNAALQWVAGHDVLLARLAGDLADGGVLALQMPYHFDDGAHHAIDEAKSDPRWRTILQGVGLHRDSVRPLLWYVELLQALGLVVDAWQTTYLHVLTGPDPVLEWFKGSALRPLLNRLPAALQPSFLEEFRRRFASAFPARGAITLLPFTRLFIVARRLAQPRDRAVE